jgi:hypothetical protein
MGVLYQQAGPASLFVTGNYLGSQNLWLGICRDRINIAVNNYDGAVPADNAGPRLPADLQNLGADANIRCTLSQHDPAVLNLLQRRGAATTGDVGPIGAFMGAGGLDFQLKIPSNYRPWTFYHVTLRSRRDGEGTEFSLIDLEFYAFALIGNSTNPSATPLFRHVFA